MTALALGVAVAGVLLALLLALDWSRRRHRKARARRAEDRRQASRREGSERALWIVAGGTSRTAHGFDPPLADRDTGSARSDAAGSATDKTPEPPAALPDERGTTHVA